LRKNYLADDLPLKYIIIISISTWFPLVTVSLTNTITITIVITIVIVVRTIIIMSLIINIFFIIVIIIKIYRAQVRRRIPSNASKEH